MHRFNGATSQPVLDIEGLPLTPPPQDLGLIKDVLANKIAPRAPRQRRHPSKDLHVIGITGTNGKTTVSYLIGEVLKSAGYNPFVLAPISQIDH